MTNGSKETINLNFFIITTFCIEAKPYLSRCALCRGIHFLAGNLYTGPLGTDVQQVQRAQHQAPGGRWNPDAGLLAKARALAPV